MTGSVKTMAKAFKDFWPGSAYSLAKKADVPEQTVRDLINGNTEYGKMSVANAVKLASTIGASVEDIYHSLYPQKNRDDR